MRPPSSEFAPRPVSFKQAFWEIFAYLRGRRPTYQEQVRDAQRVQRLAEEFAEEAPPRRSDKAR